MRKNDIEKSLKRFLKRKVSYSLSLLIAFMITGGISLGAGITAEEIQETKSDLLTRIQTEREEIRRKIEENERLIKEYNSDFVELIRKGDFYSKPTFNSTQVFFSYQHLDNGTMKNKTISEFSETIDAINKHYGTKSGRSLLKSSGNIGVDKILEGNGVAVDNEVFREEIEVGANIKPIQPDLPVVNPNISVTVSAPTVNLGALPGTVTPTIVGIPTITAPVVVTPTAPAGVSVTVTTPSAVEKITVTAPVVSVPTAPSDKNITVNAPATPAGFEPTTVTAPTAPETPTVIMPNIPDMSIGANTTGTGDNAWYWKANGDLGPINQINLTGGTFSARSASSIDSIYITNYTGAPTTTNGTANYASSEGSTADVNNGTATSSVGFYKWCGAPIIRMGSAVTINWEGAGTNRRALLKNDVHGNQATVLSTLLSGTSAETITSAEYNYIASKIYPYHNHTNTGNTDGNGSLTATRIMYGANYGTWNLSGDYINGYEADGHNDSSTNRATVFHNYGTIQTLANSSRIALLAYGAENSGYRTFTSVNSGTMTINGKTSAIFAPNRSGTNHEINFLNYGKLVINGGNNVGLYISGSSDGGSTLFMDKPLEIYGDNNIGAYFLTAGFNLNGTNSDLKINIGVNDANVTNIAQSTLGTGNDTVSGQNPTLIEGNVGISSKFAKSLKNHEIKIGTQTKSNIGFYGGHTTGTFSLGTGNITIYGGQSNIGIYTDKGDVTSSGDITLSGGVGNMAVYSTAAGKTIQVNKINTTNIEDSVVVYGANGAKITANELNVVSKVGANPTIANKKDTGAAFASGANTVITFNRATTPAAANIDITGSKLDDADRYVGFGVMATGGGVVNAKNNYIKVTNGSTAAASIGTNSNVDLSGGTVEFDGSGYAVYSDGVGKINLSNSKMILKGKATAFDVDMLAGTPPVTLDANSRIHVDSNDVVVFNLKNATGLSTNGLEASITTALGTALGGANLSNLIVAGGGIDKYKIAAVDGGTIAIGNLDKTGTGALSDTQAQKDGNFYYNRFLGQRLVATATNSTVSAVLNDTQALKFNNQVVGLEMNSSKSAVSNNEAGINLVGSTITADRDGSGLGAIGAFINYGVVTVDGTSSIKVEKESNTANNQAVGVYAVNGSTVSNAGDIKVGGDLSIGILGMAYREDSSNTPIVDEFGSLAAGQGKADITNTNKITLDGTGAVGIYAYNNNALGTEADVTVTNTAAGEIKVGHSSGANAAIGIYGDKATISNQGKVSVGDGGVAIYAKNGTKVTNLGTLDLGADAIGVMLDETSDLTATAVTVTSNNTGTLGKTVIFFKGSGTGTRNINTTVNASALDKGTAVYAEDISIVSSGALNIGTSGIGIYVKGSTANTGTNKGTITLGTGKTGAVGMYTKTANILNDTGTGVIDVNDSTQIGMYAEGTNVKAINKGTINLNVDGTTGIYVKSGAVTELDIGNTIVFNGKSSVGVFAENSSVDFKDSLTLSSTNENKNIYVYGKGATVGIDLGKIVTVDGVAAAVTPGNKTVGIYLENAGTASIFNGTTGQLAVIKEAVGIYSKGNNTLNVNVTATGDKTTGVFIDGASTISGTVTAKGTSSAGAVGVYGSGGIVTIDAGGLALNTDTGRGTGMYLTDGASAAGGTITVNNTAAGTKNIGVYYSKGTASGTVTNSSAISLIGSESIGIYAADGITLVNSANITSTLGQSDSIASYVGGGSQLTSTGTITTNDNDSIGIYAEEGKGINSGTILMNGTPSVPTKSVVGMVAEAKAGKTAAAENAAGGTISAGANLGMYIGGAGISSGTNAGTITTTTGTGVYIDGAANSFNGTGGTINSNAVGIYLKNTGANKVTAGTLNIASGGVGVFGENADIDFAVNVAGTGAVGVAAKGTSVISGNIATGQDSVGVYVLDNSVSFNGANITTGTNSVNSSIGILLNSAVGTYTMSNVTVSAQNGVGIYLDGTTPGINLTHSGTVNTVGGIGIYVDNGTTLTTGTSVLNINGGTGVYVAGGTANLGTGGSLTFNFLSGGGIGVFNNGGTMNLGANINVTGSGSLAATTNGSLSSSGNLSIGEGATGLMGLYDAGLTAAHSVNNAGTITAASGGIGLAAVKGTTNPTFPVTINSTGTINASGVSTANTPSIGIYTDIADVVNTGNINVGSKGIGIYSANNGILTSVQNNNMTMTGTEGIGVYIKGATSGLTANNIASTGSRNTGVVLEGVAGTVNVGTIALGNESVGVFVTGTAASTIDGTITTGNGSSSKSAIGVVAENGANMTLAGTATISTGANGIGVYAQGAGTTVTVSNTANITVGTEGIYMYSNNAALNFSGNITANDQIGIVADGGTINAIGASTITVQNGGIGAYVKGAAPAFGTTTIAVQAGTSSKYSMGVYYDGVAALGTAPVITQTGSYTIGMVLNNSTGTTAGGISIGSSTENNQVGIMAKGNSNLTVAGTVSISGGDNNIGVYGEDSIVTINGNVTVGDSSSCVNKSTSSIGVSLNGGSYVGTGNITAGDYSIGVFGKGMTAGSVIKQGTGTQTMTVGKDGLGIYGEGTGGTITADMSNIIVGTDNAIGVYAKGMDSIVTGNMGIGANTSIGIVSEGDGNVTYTGAMTIDNKVSAASVGIYKILGNGIITTSSGNWNIGDSGYGIYLQQAIITRNAAGDIVSSTMTSNSAAVINNADMTLGTSSVGIYSNGANTVTNTGNIIVGATDLGPSLNHNKADEHLNSIGMYLLGGTTATSSGTITVNHDHSVGVYGEGTGTRFTNTGTINIDNGAVGILVRDGAVAVNAAGANINLGGTLATCGATTVGMAAYSGARIENAGTITVNEGVGMLIGVGSTFTNTGTIFVNNGIGIEGPGGVVNTGNIVVTGTGTAVGATGLATAQVGAVEIKPDGTIKINGNYTSIGGTLTTAGAIIVDGAYVDVTTGTPLFNAHSVSGEVRLLSNFASTGNGISYEIDGFVNTAMGTITGTKLTPVTSPLFVAKVTNTGSLVIAKRPYADLTIGEQFDAMDKGLDNILKNSGGYGKDADILKGLNEYLDGLPADQFESETSKKLAEFRGDIYATIQGRMQDINQAFTNSFYELESSYNLTKDSSKYSVIYTDGKYKDNTLGIDDYDYKVMGLLYMKEKEGAEYGTKYGYTLGFAGSKFDFDDGGSKEDVYSLRVGVHRVKRLSDENKLSWLTRLDLGYNRHIAKRKLNLQETYENKGEYNTYSVSLDNRLIKTLYTDLSRELDVYGILDLEYGKIDDFKESAGSKGGLEVQIKDNDYFSAQVGAGVKASQRIYAGNDISVKATADAKYLYELGENYDRNKARLKNGDEGYYSLIKPEEREGKVVGTIGLTVEKANHMGVTFEVSAADESHKKDTSIKYAVKFNYKF